jgi:hypothetical protein
MVMGDFREKGLCVLQHLLAFRYALSPVHIFTMRGVAQSVQGLDQTAEIVCERKDLAIKGEFVEHGPRRCF